MDIREKSLQKHYEWQGKIELWLGFGLGLDRRIGNRLACGLGRNTFLGRRLAFGLRGRRRSRLACACHDDDVLVIGNRNRNVLEAFAFRHRRPPSPC